MRFILSRSDEFKRTNVGDQRHISNKRGLIVSLYDQEASLIQELE